MRAEVLRLRRRVRVFGAVIRLLLQLLRMSGFTLEAKRLAPSPARTALLRAVEHARELLPLRAVLRLAGISSSRLSSWTAADPDCTASDPQSCPRRAPNQLTADEVITIHEMVTSTEYRHVPTSRLAILAQRLGKVFASPTTWSRLVRERGWRRPRQRVHPEKPKVGLRTTRPDEAWHIDTTVVRLLGFTQGGDVSFGRLDAISSAGQVTWMHCVPPLVLLVLTRFGCSRNVPGRFPSARCGSYS